jgi:hypothetical protein
MPFDASAGPANDRFDHEPEPRGRPGPQVVVDSLMSWIRATHPDESPTLSDNPWQAMYDVLGWMLAHHPQALAKHRIMELERLEYVPMSAAERREVVFLAEQIEAAITAADRAAH